jgi:large-conductance mechanosensitive channel
MLTTQELKTFVLDNNILGYAIAMIIALTIKDMIVTFIGNLLVPGINVFLINLQIKSFSKYLPGQEKVDVLPVIKSFFTFFLTFILVYFSITLMFKSWVVPKTGKEPENIDI